MQRGKRWTGRLRALAATAALLVTGIAGAEAPPGISYAVRAEGTLASGARFGAVATGPLWSLLASGGFLYRAPERELEGVWAPFPLVLTIGEGAPGGIFSSRFHGLLNGRPVTGWVTILDMAPGPADGVLLSVFDVSRAFLFRDGGTLPRAAVTVVAGKEPLDAAGALYAALLAAFGSAGEPPVAPNAAVRQLSWGPSTQPFMLSVELNEGQGPWQIGLYRSPLGSFGFDLEIHQDTLIQWTTTEPVVIAFTPGTARLKFHDSTLLGRHLGGPRLPEDLWLAKVTLAGGALTLEGSLDAEGTRPRRYEIGGNTVKLYDGGGAPLDQWEIVK